jgi:hypothetical protein
MVQRDNGQEIPFQDLSGKLLGKVDFFLDESPLESSNLSGCGNEIAKHELFSVGLFRKLQLFLENSMRQDHHLLQWELHQTFGIQC